MKERDVRSLGQTTQAELRRQAIRMRKACQSRGKIADALGLYLKTITRWSGEHRKRGATVFVAHKRGPKAGEARHLSPTREHARQRMIVEKTPDQLKLAIALWTRRGMCELIKRGLARWMPARTCGEYLKRWGFAPQKPARHGYEQSPAAVRRWMNETYPAIAAQAGEEEVEGVDIHWGDDSSGVRKPAEGSPQSSRGGDQQMGKRSDCRPGCCYGSKGQTPRMSLPARRLVNMFSTVTNQGKVRWMIYRDTLHSAVSIRILERLIKESARNAIQTNTSTATRRHRWEPNARPVTA